ncbi:hypothetical protein HDA44_002757 [Kribbella solani]|uniref:Inositolphosphotransferase Aur1/Ipt1 domain-containing protein n=1 Tax=Kribbella solani TaxID=236067 RepID=A0A841DRL0_9ACTN|nr:hypothetical protein [Kribbella solani]
MAQVTIERVEQPLEPKPRGGARRIVREVALLAVLFGVYNLGRFLSADHAGSAFRHADKLIRWEAWLGLPSEAAVQRQALNVDGLAHAANLFYATVHFPLTAAVLLWLMIRRPAAYGRARWTFASLTGLALIGHMVFPLAPPRMMSGWVDTGVLLGQSVYGPSAHSGVANQFAAMPSLHVGWAFIIAVVMIRVTRSRLRWLWIAHPVLTFAVVVVTANHYWLDGLVAIALAVPLLLIFDSSPSARARKGSRSSTSLAAAAPMSNQSPISSSLPSSSARRTDGKLRRFSSWTATLATESLSAAISFTPVAGSMMSGSPTACLTEGSKCRNQACSPEPVGASAARVAAAAPQDE